MCVRVDALLRAGVEPRGSDAANRVLRGRSDARHPDVGFTFRYLSSQDFRESHTVNTSVFFTVLKKVTLLTYHLY